MNLDFRGLAKEQSMLSKNIRLQVVHSSSHLWIVQGKKEKERFEFSSCHKNANYARFYLIGRNGRDR